MLYPFGLTFTNITVTITRPLFQPWGGGGGNCGYLMVDFLSAPQAISPERPASVLHARFVHAYPAGSHHPHCHALRRHRNFQCRVLQCRKSCHQAGPKSLQKGSHHNMRGGGRTLSSRTLFSHTLSSRTLFSQTLSFSTLSFSTLRFRTRSSSSAPPQYTVAAALDACSRSSFLFFSAFSNHFFLSFSLCASIIQPQWRCLIHPVSAPLRLRADSVFFDQVCGYLDLLTDPPGIHGFFTSEIVNHLHMIKSHQNHIGLKVKRDFRG